MSFLDSLFGNNSVDNRREVPKYKALETMEQLDEIDRLSQEKTIVLFKHSTRCSISRFALKRFETEFNFSEEQIDWYLLDLLNHRDISNEIAHRYDIMHQSPQILVIKNGQAVYHDSHDGIDANDLKQFV